MFDDARLYSKQALVAYFIRQLRLDSDDIIIIDRATDVGQTILENKGSSKVGVVVHAEHFSEGATDGTHIFGIIIMSINSKMHSILISLSQRQICKAYTK